MAYQWNSPKEWLLEKVQEKSGNSEYLYGVIQFLLSRMDCDSIQDMFQGEMIEDGYFETLEEEEEEEDGE